MGRRGRVPGVGVAGRSRTSQRMSVPCGGAYHAYTVRADGVLAIVVDRTARPGGIRGSLRHAPTGSTSAERHVGAVANPRCCRTKASGSGAAHTEPRWETRLAIREERLCARVAPGAG